jgi:SET domain-containing protein
MNEKIIPKKSEFIEVRGSKIENGVFAKKDIPKGTKIVQYGGEKITKKEAGIRIYKEYDKAEKEKRRERIYVFDLDKKWDIDGNFSWNIGKNINHSCDPNCEFVDEDGTIWFISTKKIKKGEELGVDYGYGLEGFEDFPCKCGSKNCVGYMVGQDYWPKLKKFLKRKKFNY